MAERVPTSVESVQWFQYPPLEGGAGILDAGTQAEDTLELAGAVQQLLVGRQLGGGAEHGGHAVDELRHQAGVTVVGLAEVIGDYLRGQKSRVGATEKKAVELKTALASSDYHALKNQTWTNSAN